ncbi:hypothetical protein HPB49_005861 [Dermacentor silvarum]|uniref:Uncharacterized protein n=1 Tax=Dermacentor silvarum TaxID=543639 RepID=A0ACB8DIG0_DERSI|nr:hypothetical protein HPB49_005861 [Dermacentor silvarum]
MTNKCKILYARLLQRSTSAVMTFEGPHVPFYVNVDVRSPAADPTESQSSTADPAGRQDTDRTSALIQTTHNVTTAEHTTLIETTSNSSRNVSSAECPIKRRVETVEGSWNRPRHR